MADDQRTSRTAEPRAGAPDRYQPALNYVELDRAHRKRSRWSAILAVSVLVLVASLALLGVIGFSYLQGQAKNARIAGNADLAAVEEAFAGGGASSGEGGAQGPSIDWNTLLAENPDTVGWLYIPGTAVNYPVVQGGDNEYYLSHDFNHDQGWLAQFGAIFLDWRNNPDWSDQANFIYGHHMNDGSMFADIAGMADQGRFDASRTVYLLSPAGNFKLRSFSLIHCASDDPIVQVSFATPQDMASYIQDKIDRSVVAVGDIPAAADIPQVFAFATCDNYSAGRYVLYAYVEQEAASPSGSAGVALRDGSAQRTVDDIPFAAPPARDGGASGDEGAGQPEAGEGASGDGRPDETETDAAGAPADAAAAGDYGEYAGGYYTYDEDGTLRWVATGE